MTERISPSTGFAPLYCGMYPELATLVREHGYALAVHGSLQRDFDLICIPWVAEPSEPDVVVTAITETFSVQRVGDPDTTHHGRKRWTLAISFGECFMDLSFMPKLMPSA
ncbi:hypothetical protein [Accumulibacter sp.]|uniref:hypothetical protein n=1 Tax=Accumulibacter sp. TaxID=2053492 RepID=UPI0026029C71|nr:hypothetical protein [Accumulibacter sp.]